ncbi:axoneme-associated protein mst101(2)-like [Hypanus sabinus]|uniref:axoneme-associated protein mst101(2)-like n=1 Tax=Hypanus sabinus TaxID=79690 RepID=UPI0028C4107E|nr:axoneme-associated protein mst101(2)-like [Hypanus sabinus]XP_059831877.1 axoneme-associated protein mst101(2)-like [Hypanus sabinus]
MDVGEFIENPLEAATKSDLINLAKGLNLVEVRLSMKKREVRRAITQYYIEKNMFAAEVLENIPEKVPASGTAQLELEKLKLEHAIKLKQLEAAEKENERAEREREHALQLKELEVKREQERAEKQREHELRLKQLEAAEKEKERAEKEREAEKQRKHDLEMEKLRQEPRVPGSDREERFNVSRELRLVPPFEETDVDSYFLLFEKVAVNQKWPRGQWVALLQSVLKGKAQRAYTALAMGEEEESYDNVKAAILQSYELVPEAYRQKFRTLKKGGNQTYTEFANEKGVLLDHWCTAEIVGEDYWRLRELILIEEFKGCVSEDIQMYLNEKPNKSISEFARFADEYALTLKTKFSSNKSSQRDRGNDRESPLAEAEVPPGASGKVEGERPDGQRFPGLTCFSCGKGGHIASRCFAPRKETGKGKAAIPVGCAMVISKSTREPRVDRVREGSETCPSHGTVSVREGDTPVPVRIWRGTGAELSLISSKVLEFGRKTRMVAVKGISKGTEMVPLHKVIMDCELVSGPVEIGVRSDFPRTDADVLLGTI